MGGWNGSTRSARLPADWRRIRMAVLQRDPTCRCAGCPQCSTGGCVRTSKEVDHIQRGDDHNPQQNLRGMCPPCHAHKTGTEGAAARTARARRTPELHPGLKPGA